MTVDVVIEDDRWDDAGLRTLAERAVRAVLSCLGLDPNTWEVVVMGCDDTRIATLNADFRGNPQPTNVLSWPSEERGADAPGAVPELPGPASDPELGDIAIAFETCQREAQGGGRSLDAHVLHLLVHATLHLVGYDHVQGEDAALMERIEVEILATLGVPNPY